MSDFALTLGLEGADLAVVEDDVAGDAGIRTAALLSLFTDRRAPDDTPIPDGTTDRRGWWADDVGEFEGDLFGSRLWLLDRAARRRDLIVQAEAFDREALAWLLEDRVVSSLDVVVEFGESGGLEHLITYQRPGRDRVTLRFAHVWDGEEGSPRTSGLLGGASGLGLDIRAAQAQEGVTPLGDFALEWDCDQGAADLSLCCDDVLDDRGLRTALLLSLFTDRRAKVDDELPDGTDERRGWWADEFLEDETDGFGSRLWLLDRAALRGDLARQAEDYDREALAWLVDDGVLSDLEVAVERKSYGLEHALTFARPEKDSVTVRFAHVWDGEADRAPCPCPSRLDIEGLFQADLFQNPELFQTT